MLLVKFTPELLVAAARAPDVDIRALIERVVLQLIVAVLFLFAFACLSTVCRSLITIALCWAFKNDKLRAVFVFQMCYILAVAHDLHLAQLAQLGLLPLPLQLVLLVLLVFFVLLPRATVLHLLL